MAAACFDLSDRTLLELTGADRARFLHSFSTNDIKRLAAGQGCEAFVVNVKGQVVGPVWIDAVAQSLWLDADKGAAERLIPHLERYVVNEDVAIADRTADWGKLLVTGPEAAGGLGRLGIDVAGLANLEHKQLDVDKAARAQCGGSTSVRTPGTFCSCRASGQRIFGACWAEARVQPAGEEVWTALRIEAGLPQFGVDISDENLAQEVGRTKSAISFTKGCYLGQEPIARIDAMGHVNRELRSLRLDGEAVPPLQSRVFSDAAGTSPPGSGAAGALAAWRYHVGGVLVRAEGPRGAGRLAARFERFWQPRVCRDGRRVGSRDRVLVSAL